MHKLFSPWMFRDLELPNRLIRSATWEGMADDSGFVTDRLIELYRNLAKGGVGLIITGYAYVRPDGKGLPRQLGVYSNEHVKGLRSIAEAIHEEGGKAIVQLVHAGGQTSKKVTGIDSQIAPSSVYYPSNDVTPRAIETDEIPELIADFADAALRAVEAGFDGVQLHAAHGYLINRFLSPASNQREDEYGGSALARSRFAVETIQAIRKEIGEKPPISAKLNSEDFEEGGLVLSDSIVAAEQFEEAGADHVEVSGGTPAAGKLGAVRMGINKPEQEAYFADNAARIREQLSMPTGVVGGIRSFEVAEELIASGRADTVSLCRPLICEPGLPARWQSGDLGKSICTSDSGCFMKGLNGGISCAVHGGG